MIIKVLGGWTYTPKFAGNKNMTVTFTRLSGRQDLEVNAMSEDDIQTSVNRFLASIEKITNPLKLEGADGKQRDMTKEDIAEIPELKELYFELIIEYSNHTAVTEDSVKKLA